MVMEACPSSSETTFTLTPLLNSSVAHVCRRSWKRRSFRTLALVLIRLKERLRRFEGLKRGAGLVGEYESLILPKPGQAQPLFELAFAMLFQGRGCLPGKAHTPTLARLGARANNPPSPVLSTCERAPHAHGGLASFEVHIFPTHGQQLAFTQTTMDCHHIQSFKPLSA